MMNATYGAPSSSSAWLLNYPLSPDRRSALLGGGKDAFASRHGLVRLLKNSLCRMNCFIELACSLFVRLSENFSKAGIALE